jgi:uracil-DNA glycosylase
MAALLTTTAANYLPSRLTRSTLHEASEHCRGCELYKDATQTVFGDGPAHAEVMLVGEMPGDEEDKQGEAFVGPAGRLLDELLYEAGIDRAKVYVTNAVKHFRWEPRGKRRLHKKSSARQIEACEPWLQAEILVTRPTNIVCLGATAARAMLGHNFLVTEQHGEFFPGEVATLVATYHPSAILRTPEKSARDRMRAELVADLRRVAQRRRRSASRR